MPMIELADTSAWTNRRKDPLVEADFDAALLAERIAVCPMVELELLWTARSPEELRRLRGWLEALPAIPIEPETWTRAMDVWQLLADRGRHRQVRQADLLIAAAAELAGVGVCHYDAGFELIASVTGQPVRAIAPLGTL